MNAPNFSPAQLLEELRGRGVVLTAIGDRLRYDAPAGAIGDLIGDLQRFKPQLIELLDADTQIVASRAATAPVTIDVVEYVRARSAGYWARQRAHAEVARRMPVGERAELERLIKRLDAGLEIE